MSHFIESSPGPTTPHQCLLLLLSLLSLLSLLLLLLLLLLLPNYRFSCGRLFRIYFFPIKSSKISRLIFHATETSSARLSDGNTNHRNLKPSLDSCWCAESQTVSPNALFVGFSGRICYFLACPRGFK